MATRMQVTNELQIASEVLAEDELALITGYHLAARQIQWLNSNGWKYVLTHTRKPVVGRVYARLKLAGVSPTSTNAVAETWTLDLKRVT